MANQELIDGLNVALNREISTALRYMVQGSMIRGSQWEPVRKMYLEEVEDELGHAQYLAAKIFALGGAPKLAPDLSPPPSDINTMLANDIEEEKKDVAHYLKLAEMAARLDLPDLRLHMEDQAADEARHAEEMKRLRG